MATAELGPHPARRALAAADLPPLELEEKHSNVVVFDPNGRPSRGRPLASESANPEPASGFTYDGVRAGRAIRAGLSRRSAASRPLPMEQVCLYVKSIDNSGVRRRTDVAEKRIWTKVVALGFLLVGLVLLAYGPRSGVRQSGYRLEDLEKQKQALLEVNRQLRVRQAMLSDLKRVSKLAAERGFRAPPPDRFDWQNRTISPAEGGGELVHSRDDETR